MVLVWWKRLAGFRQTTQQKPESRARLVMEIFFRLTNITAGRNETFSFLLSVFISTMSSVYALAIYSSRVRWASVMSLANNSFSLEGVKRFLVATNTYELPLDVSRKNALNWHVLNVLFSSPFFSQQYGKDDDDQHHNTTTWLNRCGIRARRWNVSLADALSIRFAIPRPPLARFSRHFLDEMRNMATRHKTCINY